MKILKDESTGRTTVLLSEAEYAALLDEDTGVCIECGETSEGTEPDARRYRCPRCGLHTVYGLEYLAIAGRIEFTASKEN